MADLARKVCKLHCKNSPKTKLANTDQEVYEELLLKLKSST